MPNRPIHIFVDNLPPADLVAAARRGECWVLQGARPTPTLRLARALVAWADAVESQIEVAAVGAAKGGRE